MATYYMALAELRGLLDEQDASSTFAPTLTGALAWMDALDVDSAVRSLTEPRASQSPKGFFMPAAESLRRYGLQGGAVATETATRTLVLFGVRACELRAAKYLDHVLLEGEFTDSLYQQRRNSTVIVSCDCLACTESCFCTMVGGLPYPTEGFDVNITALDDGCLVEVATDRGREWLGPERLGRLAEASAEQLARRDRLRQEMVRRLEEQNAAFGLKLSDQQPPKLPNDADGSWGKFSADCVECGACTNICPTCHCFYLYDQALGPEEFERVRTWDSCLFSTYHRMAGGPGMKLTPRPKLSSRLANRVLHKFAYSPQQYGVLGCVGCGRCVEACIGAIDIRQVVKELSE